MTYKEKIENLVDAAESNLMDGDHATIAENLCEALGMIKALSELLESCNYYLDEVEA